MSNIRFQNALKKVPQAVPPIWFMRQAGRYHQHYQNLKKTHTFMQLCKDPKLAAEVALGPIEDFDFDVSILFSDLLFPLEALGMGLHYDNGGPELGMLLNSENLRKLNSLHKALPFLEFQKEAMLETRKRLPKDKSLIGFVGGPWTLFTYAVEGEHSGNLIPSKVNLSLFPDFCELLIPLLIENIKLQFQGGAEVVMLFDTAAGELSPAVYQHYVIPQLQKLAAAFAAGKLGYYSKYTQGAHLQHAFFQSGQLAGLGFDHRHNLPQNLIERSAVPGFVQGNFDQALLFLPTKDFLLELDRYLKPYLQLSREQRAGWVCGLGHGVLPKTPESHVRLFIEKVREVFA